MTYRRLYLYRRSLGKPDGWLIRLRCRILGHAWFTCWEDCCEAETDWCNRCLAPRSVSRLVGIKETINV